MKKILLFTAIVFILLYSNLIFGQTQTYTTPGSYTFTVPAGVNSIDFQAWGGGGCSGFNSTGKGRGGGGGGAFTSGALAVTPGASLTIVVGAGGVYSQSSSANENGENSSVGVAIANGGSRGLIAGDIANRGAGGVASTNPGGITSYISYKGGNGGNGYVGVANGGGGGGGASASSAGIGNNGSNGTAGGSGGVGGLGNAGGGDGGRGADNNGTPTSTNGVSPGGGGGGRGDNAGTDTNGGAGKVLIYILPTITSFTPSSACAASGASVVITGTNFNGGTAVNFNGVPATSFTVNSNTQITAQLPATATSGTITVTTPGGIGTSASSFTVNAVTGNQTSYGVNSWIGYVYASTNGGNPPSNAFTTNYVGYITQLESFDLNLVNGAISGPNLCSTNADNFAVRFKMNKNMPVGYYTFNVGGDDGYRLSIDGGATNVITNWNAHPYQNTIQTFFLNGNTNFVLEYFENTGQSRVQFSYTFCPSSTAPTGISGINSLCNGDTTTLTATGGVLATNGAYQWGTGSTIGSNIIPGQTAATLAIAPTATTTYWVRILDCTTNLGAGVTKVITVNPTSVGGTATGGTKICSGSTSGLMTLAGHTGTITKWQSSISPFSIWTDIANTSTTYTSGVLTATTQFRAVVQSGSCAVANSSVATVTVNAITPNKVDETCPSSNNGSISPTLSGGISNVRYIKLTQKYNVDAWQQVAEIEAFEIFTGVNVARSTNGATAMSSSDYNATYLPAMAIDGNNSGNNNFWHSGTPNLNEWIRVDLQSGKNIDFIKIFNRTDCCRERGQNMLLELFDGSNNLVYSKTIDLYQSGANVPVNVNVLDVSWADGSTTLNRTGLDSGAYTLNYADAVGCSVSSPIVIGATNTAPSIPTLGAITQPCIIATGSVVLNGLPGSGTLNQTGAVANSYAITGTTMTISGLIPGTYNFTVSNGLCTSGTSGNVGINSVVTKTWTVAGWSPFPLVVPTIDDVVIFAGTYNSLGNLDGCTCTVNSGVKVVFNPTHTLKITNGVNVSTALGTSLTFEDTASLVQINNNAINTGNIIYKRLTSTTIDNFDYTYWSSPVSPQNLLAVSPSTSQDKFYSFNLTTNDWQQENPNTKNMVSGIGYIIRGPQTYVAPAPANFYKASFIGLPNNGVVTVAIPPTAAVLEASALIGNPYPSALDADLFLIANRTGALEGTLYLWTHNTNIGVGTANLGSGTYAYTSDDYATYNLTGGVGTGVGTAAGGLNNSVPNGKIASGQAFFAGVNPAGGTVTFNNSMRIGGGILDNAQFFKINNTKSKESSSVEKDRVWLNLYNSQGAFKQALVGYITGATNEYDNGYDGATFDGNEFVDFYSVNQDKNLVIQGRALPFDEADEVPLGYKTTIVGDFTIAIAQIDGLLAKKDIFIEDKEAQKVTNLKEGAYKFTTEAGTFNDRFVLRYTDKTLGRNDFDLNDKNVLIAKDRNELKIKSSLENIKRVTVFDLLGRKVFDKEAIDTNEFHTSNITVNKQTVVVKVTLSNGKVISKKVIY